MVKNIGYCHFRFLLILFFLFQNAYYVKASEKNSPQKFKDTQIVKYYGATRVPVNIKFAAKPIGNILVLPGWNYKATEWCDKTELCEVAFAKNFNLIFVEMQRSVYLKSYFPQTRKEYKIYPTRKWLIDSAFKPLITKNVISRDVRNYVMGLSTGGRGAAIMALDYPDVFSAAASLSGDFDPTLQKNDNLMINSLGPYQKYASLWEGDNNITRRAAELKVPIYIGHGKSDKVSPLIQSVNYVNALNKNNKSLRVISHFPDKMGHDYVYWNSEVKAILDFFSSIE